MKKFYLETYGCSANKSDSEIIFGILEKNGYEHSNFDEAEIVIINTCGVKKATEDRILNRLRILSKTNKKIVVAGCLPKINLEKIKKALPNFSAIVDPQSIHKIPEILEKIKSGEKGIVNFSKKSPEKPLLPKHSFNKVISIVQILEGCLSKCSYCGTKLARGDLMSYKPSSILESVSNDVKNGFKEIWLTSQDNSCYGKDIGTNFANLLQCVSKIKGKFFVRAGMMNPLHIKNFLDDLIDAYKDEKIFKFLHLPVQSGSNKVLKDMRRGYKVEDFLFYIKKFREEIPEITISTDIIVGFPTETEVDFNKTVSLIKKIKPAVVNISRFSPRKGTPAAEMKMLKPEIVNKRSAKIHNIVKKIQARENEKWLGWKGEVLIDEIGKKNMLSRNLFYKPIVTRGVLGKFRKVKIIETYATYLIGK